MNLQSKGKWRPAIYAAIILIGVWVIWPSGMNYLFDTGDTIGMQLASADKHYGILGQQAPELNLTSWIDSDGKPMDPVKLKDYRGKVIFLYFFQYW